MKLSVKPRRNLTFRPHDGLSVQSATPWFSTGRRVSSITQFNKIISGSFLKELWSPEFILYNFDSRQCFCGIPIALPLIFSGAKGTKRDTALLLPLVPLISSSVTGEELSFLIQRDRGDLCIRMLQGNQHILQETVWLEI